MKSKGHQFDNFVIIGGTVSCRNDNLRCHRWWESCQIDDIWFSVTICLSATVNIKPWGTSADYVVYQAPLACYWLITLVHIISTRYRGQKVKQTKENMNKQLHDHSPWCFVDDLS